ncbi:MAG: hypothetical protein Q9203_005470 [Teloschistes exilis]
MTKGSIAELRPPSLDEKSQESENIVKKSGPKKGQDKAMHWRAVLGSENSCGRKGNSLPRNLLPGDTKLSTKWDASPLPSGYQKTEDVSIDTKFLGPLRQIYTYCVQAKERYGYLITDKALFVVRIRPMPQGAADSKSSGGSNPESSDQSAYARIDRAGVLEFKLIPWEDHEAYQAEGSEGLTINLALWWLYMLGADGSEVEDSYPPLKDHKDYRRKRT